MANPDWNATVSYMGGHLDDVPEPHIRKYPNDYGKKRIVRISISTYEMAGGRHYYVSMREEPNPIWDVSKDSRLGGWRACWDDTEGRGRSTWALLENDRFDLRIQAEQAIQEAIDKYFPADLYEIRYDGAVQDINLPELKGRLSYAMKHGE